MLEGKLGEVVRLVVREVGLILMIYLYFNLQRH